MSNMHNSNTQNYKKRKNRKKTKQYIRFPEFAAGLVNEQATFRREDLYGPDGR